MDARPPERPPVTQAINTIGAHVDGVTPVREEPPVEYEELTPEEQEEDRLEHEILAFQAVSLKLRYETFLMQVLGVILWDMHTCPPEFLRAFDQERHLLNVDFVACGLMN